MSKTILGPLSIEDWVFTAKAGDTLVLQDGTYPTLHLWGLKGTKKKPITVRAQHDGEVLIDGGYVRPAILLDGCEYVVVQGVNACCARADVVEVVRSDHCTIRRVCAWDARMDWNAVIFGCHYGTHNSFIDCAAWGTGRKMFSASQGGDHTTFLRCCAWWDGSTNVGGKGCLTVCYNNIGTRVDKCFFAWRASRMPAKYKLMNNGDFYTRRTGAVEEWTTIEQPMSVLCGGTLRNRDTDHAGVLVTNSIFCVSPDSPGGLVEGVVWIDDMSGVTLRNILAVGGPNDRGLFLNNPDGTYDNLVADHVTSIGGKADITRGWKVIPGAAKLRLKFPMEKRIKAACGVSVAAQVKAVLKAAKGQK